MILEPINDIDCLGQLTAMARELAPTTLIRAVAARLGSRTAVIKWMQGLPQTDDFGDESVRFINCDVPQRVRLLPDDPNCVERSLGALMLLEALDPRTPRALATVDRPMRHTGLVEKYDGHWHAVDLFPRRNAQRNFKWDDFGKDVLQGVHSYVGKPLLKFYAGDAGGQVADTLGENEDKLIGRDKKKQPEKKPTPSPAGTQRPGEQPKRVEQGKQQPAAKAQPVAKAQPARVDFARFVTGAGANQGQATGGTNGKEAKDSTRGPGAAAVVVDSTARSPGEAHAGEEATARNPGDSHDQGAEPQRWWWEYER